MVGRVSKGGGRHDASVYATLNSPAWRATDYGQASTVPLLVRAAVGGFDGIGPWVVALTHQTYGEERFRVNRDGSVQWQSGHGLVALAPAGTIAVPRLPVFSAHHGSGATTWAQLLDADEVSAPGERRPLVVIRSTLAGVEAAKAHTRTAGAVLVVADAAGSVPAEVRRAVRVLEGAAPVVRVPWVPALRGVIAVPDSPAIVKVGAKVAATVHNKWRGL